MTFPTQSYKQSFLKDLNLARHVHFFRKIDHVPYPALVNGLADTISSLCYFK